MTTVFNPLAMSISATSQAGSQYSILSCGSRSSRCSTNCGTPGVRPMLRSSFFVERIQIVLVLGCQDVRKQTNLFQLSRIRSAGSRRHHRRRDDYNDYMRSKEKPQQGPGKVQFKSNDRKVGSEEKVVITLDIDEFKHRASDAVVVAQKTAERSIGEAVQFAKNVAAESKEGLRELRSSVRVQKDRNIIISFRRSSLEFAGKAVVGSVLLVVFCRLLFGAMKEYRWGWEEGFGRSRVVRDRSLGGKEVSVNDKGVQLWEGGPAKKAVSVARAARGPLDMPLEDSRSEKELQKIARAREQTASPAKKAPRLPRWWPEPDLPLSTSLTVRQRADEEAARLVNRIMQKRLGGSEFSAEDILQLRQLCKTSGSKVKFDTYNTRDSFYRAAVNVVLSACQRAGKWSMTDFGSEGGVRFIAGLAANVGLESERAATIVNAAVAARTRAGLLQARALRMQSKFSESEEELLKLIRLHSCFPPDADSAEMEMVARGLGSHFDREGRVEMLQIYNDLGGAQTKRVVAEALGLLLRE